MGQEKVKPPTAVELGRGGKWQSLDASFAKSPVAGSTKTGKIGVKRSILVDTNGIPISIVIAGANIPDAKLLDQTIS